MRSVKLAAPARSETSLDSAFPAWMIARSLETLSLR